MKKYKAYLLIFIAVLVVFVGCMSFASFSGAFSSDKRIEGIEDVAISFEDFEIPKDVKVVGIGEATHGNSELQTVKREVFEKVVTNGNGRAIAFEMSVGDGAMINDAIHDPDSDLVAVIKEQTYELYKTEEIVALLQWMKDYNMNVPYEESLMFYGVDMQDRYTGIIYLKGICDKGTDLLTKEEQDYIKAIDLSVPSNIDAGKDFFQKAHDRLETKGDLKSKQLAMVFTMILQILDAPDYERHPIDFSNNRDQKMGENLISYWEIDNERGYSQIVVTGHNAHVMKGSSSCVYDENDLTMGDHIDRLSGGSYFCIGTDYYNALVDMHVAGTYDENYLRIQKDYCSEDKLAYQAHFMEDGRYCLDFSKITDENSEVYQIINDYNFMGLMGEGYCPAQDLVMGDRMKVIATQKFDAVIYYYYLNPINVY